MRTSGGLSSERCWASSWRLFSERSYSARARRSAGFTRSTVRDVTMCRWNRGSVATRAAPAAASTGSIALLRLVDRKRAPFEVLAVQRLHGAGSIGVRHFHKAEAARAPRVAIGDQRNLFDASMRCEQSAHTLLSCRERKISDVEFGHWHYSQLKFEGTTAVRRYLLQRASASRMDRRATLECRDGRQRRSTGGRGARDSVSFPAR